MSVGGIGRTDFTPTIPAETPTTTATGGALRSPAFAGNATLAEVASGLATLANGSRGEPTRRVQQALVDLGFLAPRPGADGIFGRMTFAAVQAFQRAQGLPATGIVDSATLRALDARIAGGATGAAGSPFAGDAFLAEVAAGRQTLATGARGEPTRKVQAALIELGHLGRQPGADGIFGRQTAAAVSAFQRAAGLPPTGIVDAATLRAIEAKVAERAGGSGTAPVGGRPPVIPAPPPEPMRVVEGTSDYSLDDDTLFMVAEGRFTSSIGRDIYVAGYLPRTDGPLNRPLGTDHTPSSILPDAQDRWNTEKSPVERFDELMRRATGTAGTLAEKYAVDGKQPEAESWWGYCDRWAYASLDPEIASRVNQPIMLNGVYFSTAELRGLATYLGRSDEDWGRTLFDNKVTPLDLQKATTMFLKLNGPGFISDVWLDSAHPGNAQVWNQPFDAVDQNVKELKGADLERVLREEFNLTGDAARGKRLWYVETTGHYGVEAGEEHEGPATHAQKNWKSYILTGADGKAIDGKWHKDSDEAPEWIWRPHRTGQFSREGAFFRDLLKTGVPVAKTKEFEAALAGLRGRVDDATKAQLVARFKGVAAAYPQDALAAKLAPLGLTPADFR